MTNIRQNQSTFADQELKTTSDVTFKSEILSNNVAGEYIAETLKNLTSTAGRPISLSFNSLSNTSVERTFGKLSLNNKTVTNGAEVGEFNLSVMASGTLIRQVTINPDYITAGGNTAQFYGYIANSATTNRVGYYFQTAGSTDWYIYRQQSGSNLSFQGLPTGYDVFTLTNSGSIYMPYVYGTTVSSGVRNLYIQSDGQIGGISSLRETKKDIVPIGDTSWIYDVEICNFKYKSDTTQISQSGIIVDDVYSLLQNRKLDNTFANLILFNTIKNENADESMVLAGFEYLAMIPILWKELQLQKIRNDLLEQKIIDLENL